MARVDLRMNAKGDIYVLEVNPLPGLTPGYSDLCLIAKAADIEYRALIGEILAGGLKRLREKRRAEAVKSADGGRAPGCPRRPCPGRGRRPPTATATGPRTAANGGNGGPGPEDKPGVSGT